MKQNYYKILKNTVCFLTIWVEFCFTLTSCDSSFLSLLLVGMVEVAEIVGNAEMVDMVEHVEMVEWLTLWTLWHKRSVYNTTRFQHKLTYVVEKPTEICVKHNTFST